MQSWNRRPLLMTPVCNLSHKRQGSNICASSFTVFFKTEFSSLLPIPSSHRALRLLHSTKWKSISCAISSIHPLLFACPRCSYFSHLSQEMEEDFSFLVSKRLHPSDILRDHRSFPLVIRICLSSAGRP